MLDLLNGEDFVAASMGLRDWVSEKVEGAEVLHRLMVSLQWGSETGSRRRPHKSSLSRPPDRGFNGAPRLGLGEGKGRAPTQGRADPCFNGAPRLGLGEGLGRGQ